MPEVDTLTKCVDSLERQAKKQTKEGMRINDIHIMPPSPGKCPVCAAEHDPNTPHDAQSLYYRMKFLQKKGRFPSWKDAMAHCDGETQRVWGEALKARGIDMGEAADTNETNEEVICE